MTAVLGTTPAPGAPAIREPASANGLWGEDWADVAALWSLDPDVLHLNHGSFGAVPVSVQRAQALLRSEMDANPVRWFRRRLPSLVVDARIRLASALGADPDGFALVVNASAGVSAVLASFALRPGDEVVLTDHAYGAVRFAVEGMCERAGARVVTVALPFDADPAQVVAAIAAALSDRTRLLVIDQITSATAWLLPVREIVAAAHARGVPVLVDGAHAPGMLELAVDDLGADFWVGNLHKWPCAPRGTAGLAVAPAWRDAMRTLTVSWGERDGFPLSFDQAGTVDATAWLAAPAAVELLRSLGWQRLREHNRALAAYGQQVVADALGSAAVHRVGDELLSMRLVPLATGVATSDAAASALQDRIAAELRTEAMVVTWGGQGFLRVSAHAYNAPADYEWFAVAVRELLAR